MNEKISPARLRKNQNSSAVFKQNQLPVDGKISPAPSMINYHHIAKYLYYSS